LTEDTGKLFYSVNFLKKYMSLIQELSMKWIFSILCSFIMFQSVAFAQEPKASTSLNTDNTIGRNILWLNGDLGIARQLDYQLSDHIQPSEKEQDQYYAIGLSYDYSFDKYGFFRFGANFSRYKIQFSHSEEGYDLTTYKSEITTFDPSLGLRYVSPNLFPEFKVFFDFGLYSSIIRVKTHSKYYEDGDYLGSSSENFYDDPNFGVYAGFGSLYKFTDNICSTLSMNFKLPANSQNAYDNKVYEAEADDYYPLFIYISFSVGYMF